MPQTEDIEYIKKYEAYDCINTSEDDDFDPLDELAKAVDKITADTYNIKSGARPAITAVSKFIDSKLLSHFSRMAKTYRSNQN